MSKKNIYALLVAINDYTDVKQLYGCLNDMHAFRDYLKKQYKGRDFKLHPLELANEEATRQAVIDGFKHFEQAREGDVCVLFFSGHGSQVPTTDFFEATDNKNEAIVCYDGCLVDKELSCLIYEVTKDKPHVHFVAVMDCCHSGSNSRFVDDSQTTNNRCCSSKKYPLSISDYYGFEKGLYEKDAKGQYTAKKGKHIQLGACRSHQLAVEKVMNLAYRGVFSYSLLEALDTAFSALSYADLERRIVQKISNYANDQRPQLDPVNNDTIDQLFLGGAIVPKNRFFIAWDKTEKQWTLNAGLYHGVNTQKEHPSVIRLADNPDVYFDILDIKSDTSIGVWRPTNFVGNQQKQYDVILQIGGGRSHLVAFSSDCDPVRKAVLLAEFAKIKTNYIELTDDREQAAYFIHTEFNALGLNDKLADYFKNVGGNALWLRLKGEEKPLFFPIAAAQMNAVQTGQFWRNADAVLQWQHLKTLENPTSSIANDVKITLYRHEGSREWKGLLPENMERIGEWSAPTAFRFISGFYPAFALTVENTGSQQLHVSALVMDGRFGIVNKFLPYEKIEPNGKAQMIETYNGKSSQSIGLTINQEAYEDGRKEQMDYLKIMVSTQAFETTDFVQEALDVRGASTMRSSKDAVGSADFPVIQIPDWVTFLVPLHIFRP